MILVWVRDSSNHMKRLCYVSAIDIELEKLDLACKIGYISNKYFPRTPKPSRGSYVALFDPIICFRHICFHGHELTCNDKMNSQSMNCLMSNGDVIWYQPFTKKIWLVNRDNELHERLKTSHRDLGDSFIEYRAHTYKLEICHILWIPYNISTVLK